MQTIPESQERLDWYRRWNAGSGPYFAWQAAQFAGLTGSRVADVGCGIGNLTPFFREAALYLAFEPDPVLAGEFRRRWDAPNIRLAQCADITDGGAAREMRALGVETVVCVNVLEHIADDAKALANMIEGAAPGGTVCLLVPAHPFLYGTLDALDGHYRRYTKAGLRKLAREAGGGRAETVRLRYFNLPGAFGWFLKGRVLKERAHTDGNFRLMSALVPAVSRFEALIEPPAGLSLVMILRKKM